MTRHFLALAALLGHVLAWPSPGAAQGGDAVLGEALARRWCGGCHALGARPAGPLNDAAPGFAAIAARPGMTASRIAAFLRHPHPPMPDLALSAPEIADVAAHIASLAPPSR